VATGRCDAEVYQNECAVIVLPSESTFGLFFILPMEQFRDITDERNDDFDCDERNNDKLHASA